MIIKNNELAIILLSLISYNAKRYKKIFKEEYLEILNWILFDIITDFKDKKLLTFDWNYKQYVKIRTKKIIKQKIKIKKRKQKKNNIKDNIIWKVDLNKENEIEWFNKKLIKKMWIINKYKREMEIFTNCEHTNYKHNDNNIKFTFFNNKENNKKALIKIIEKYSEFIFWLEDLNKEEIIEIEKIKKRTLIGISEMWMETIKETIKIFFIKLMKWNNIRIKDVNLPTLLKNF